MRGGCVGLVLSVLGVASGALGAVVLNIGPHRFEDYPAKVYHGSLAMPDFVHYRRFRGYRTRLREDSRGGVDFGGRFATVVIGCGTGCSNHYFVDLKSGQIIGFPFGGETDHRGGYILEAAQTYGRPNSRLIKTQWLAVVDDKHICRREEFVLKGTIFVSIWHDEAPGDCPYEEQK